MTSRSLGHRAPLLWLVIPFFGGLAAARLVALGNPSWPLALAAAAVTWAIIAAWKSRRAWAPAIVSAMFFAGAASFALHHHRLGAWEELPPREARLAARIDRVFPPSFPNRISGLATITRAAPHLRDLVGHRIYFAAALRSSEPPPIRSATIALNGVLVALPVNPETDTFDAYLVSSGVHFRLTRARVLGEEAPPSAYYRFCARAAARFKTILGLGIDEKRPALTGLLRAMMLGETSELSDEQHALFMQSGTMHLFAISGLNIAVIAGTIQALLLLLRLTPWPRFAIGTALLWLFVDITGGAPSAVRAFIMAAFLMAAFVLRRPANPLAALAASALVVMLAAPLQVFSASFLMSYGIVTALLILGLPLGEAWLARWTPWRDLPEATWTRFQKNVAHMWRALAVALAIGLATTLVSTLTGVQFFQLFTPGSLLANLLLIPAAMAATVAGFASILCGLIGFETGAALCNHAAALVLFLIDGVVRLGVQIPGAHVPARFVAQWIGLAAIGALLATLFLGYATDWKRGRGGWWPPFAIVAVVLAFGTEFGK